MMGEIYAFATLADSSARVRSPTVHTILREGELWGLVNRCGVASVGSRHERLRPCLADAPHSLLRPLLGILQFIFDALLDVAIGLLHFTGGFLDGAAFLQIRLSRDVP